MAAEDRERWLARIEATRRYWLFVDLVWLADCRSVLPGIAAWHLRPHMACPICVSPEGAAITAGMRAGAGVLILVTALIVDRLIARFGMRLWAAEGASAEGAARMIDRWLPAAASAHARALDAVLSGVHAHMLLIFAVWLASSSSR